MSKMLSTKEYIQRLETKNISYRPTEQYKGHMVKIKHICNICKYVWEIRPNDILRGRGCPVCNNGNMAIKGYTDIATTNPELVSLFKNIEDTYSLKINSRKKVKLICPECNQISVSSPILINRYGFKCKYCSDGLSYPNKFIRNMFSLYLFNQVIEYKFEYQCALDEYNEEINREKFFYDMYFVKDGKQYVVEMDGGIGHGNNTLDKSMKDSLLIDKEKDKLAIESGIHIIRIDCNYSDYKNRYEFIKRNILDSVLSNILDLSIVDFDEINKASLESNVIKVCNLFNEGVAPMDIDKHINITFSTVYDYLHIGNCIGLCKFNPVDNRKELMSKKVINITDNVVFDSVRDANEKYKVNICPVLKGKASYAGINEDGYKIKWIYYDDFLKLSDEEQLELFDKKELATIRNGQPKKVIKISSKEIFNSVKEAERKYKGKSIGYYCRNKLYKYDWMFYDDYLKIS